MAEMDWPMTRPGSCRAATCQVRSPGHEPGYRPKSHACIETLRHSILQSQELQVGRSRHHDARLEHRSCASARLTHVNVLSLVGGGSVSVLLMS